ncbi:MAG TPA: TetR family transcriptional regulator [Micromonosporaceae bacterium]|nr:TetR family transcriptional regulator [Micromonosporaceae bacterium]
MSDRSQRRRELTRAEIKGAARAQLVKAGPSAISLRAIARDMGITAPALYRYYPALDSLILELCTDLYVELRLACEGARDLVPAEDHVKRLQDMAREFRRWVLAHPAETALIFGPPMPGVEQFHEQCVDLSHAGAQFGQIFIDPLLALHAQGRLPVGKALVEHEEVPADVYTFFLNAWTQFYGLIMAEAFGHLSWAVTDAEPLFEAQLEAFTESLVS